MVQEQWSNTPSKSAGEAVTAAEWNAIAADLRALIDRTTSATSTGALPIGIDIANSRVYIGGTPEDASHANTPLSVSGTATATSVVTGGANGAACPGVWLGSTAVTGAPKIVISSSEPSSPTNGMIWFDTS